MNSSVQTISLSGLIWAFAPPMLVIVVLFRWALKAQAALYAIARMLIQLLLIGYVLTYIFEADHPAIIMLVLAVMLGAGKLDRAAPPSEEAAPSVWESFDCNHGRRDNHPHTHDPGCARG